MKPSSRLIALVHRYQRSSELRWRELYARAILDRLETELRFFLLGKCQERFVEDLLQEVYTAVFGRLKEFKGERSSQFLGWVRTVARRKLIDHYRQEARNPAAPNAEEPLDEILAEACETLQRGPDDNAGLDEVIYRLRKLDRMCFELLWNRYVVGYSITELAKAFGVTYDAMRVRIDRCEEAAGNLGGEDHDL